MSIIETLKPQLHAAFPRLASGKYIHFLMLRHSQSFPIFQTDGILNTTRTQAGLATKESVSRLVMFKRKQTSPERLTGRELLRSFSLINPEKGEQNSCRYGGENFCGQCPDCVIYGFAVGDSGSERSKVYSDSAFSLSPYNEHSRRIISFNALSESGTMMRDSDDPKRTETNRTRDSINQQEHILPEVTFPTVETLRDSTFEGFIYVLGNLIRTRRYGAQESRTGTMANHIIGIALCDGEIFSNLHFTQALFDVVKNDLDAPISDLRTAATTVAKNLLNQEPVRKTQLFFEDELNSLLTTVNGIYQDEAQLREILSTLHQQTQTYAATYGAVAGKRSKGKKGDA